MKEKHKYKIIISCEHGGNHVPSEYRVLFRGKQSILQSHLAWDKGALVLAKELAANIHGPLFFSETTRLLVDLNRSLHHPKLFSKLTRGCSSRLKTEILTGHYHPYRNKLENAVRKHLAADNTVIHLSVHSFAPRLGKELRRADIGLLYDPRRPREHTLCRSLQASLRMTLAGLIVRRNYPYRGTADGLTTYLRKRYGQGQYLGIEIEINQKLVHPNLGRWKQMQKQIISAINLSIRPLLRTA